MYKDARIYVAGHRGLLGTAILQRLRSEGCTNVLTRTHQELDLTKRDQVDEFFHQERPEYVFLCAGLTGGIHANKTYPAKFLQTNLRIQVNVFEAAQKTEVRHLIFYGSSCIYPKNSPQPMKESYLMTGEIETTSEAYAIAKIAGIVACRAFNNQYMANRFIALVPNSMYGPHDNFDPENSHVLSSLIGRFHEAKETGASSVTLWGSGNPRREFIYSDDVADASIFCMSNAARLQNNHYNLGTGIDYSIKELANMVSEIVGFTGKTDWDTTKPDGAPRKLLDCSRFLSLGWKPATLFQDGLELTYRWYRSSLAAPDERMAHG
jgi:GDP-L-fucose synthase